MNEMAYDLPYRILPQVMDIEKEKRVVSAKHVQSNGLITEFRDNQGRKMRKSLGFFGEAAFICLFESNRN
jgi:hypothetical protein